MEKSESTGLAEIKETSGEMTPTSAAAEKQFEIQSAIVVAKKFPRNEDKAFEKLMKACGRPSFSEEAMYKFPRGGIDIEGPSVNMAREAARVWGNIRYGIDIIVDDDEIRQIRAWAWDMETNVKVTAEDTFKKLIFRKKGGWIKPDERDLRELTNRRGAIAVRNCILQILPKDLVEDAMIIAKNTLKDGVSVDPDSAKKKVIMAFSGINVTPDDLETYLGHKISGCSPEEVANLRQIYQSISDGNSKWSEYVSKSEAPEKEEGSLDIDKVKKSDDENRGHGNEGFDEGGEKKALLFSVKTHLKKLKRDDEYKKHESMSLDELVDACEALREDVKKVLSKKK